jgi:hypothetical protein
MCVVCVLRQDVYELFGGEVGGATMSLVELVLRSESMRPTLGEAAEYPNNAVNYFNGSVERVLGLLDGTVAHTLSKHETVRQRYPGTNAARTVRAPIVIDADTLFLKGFTLAFIDALKELRSVPSSVAVGDRQFVIVVFTDNQDAAQRMRISHHKAAAPRSTFELAREPGSGSEGRTLYLTLIEKLAFVLLLLQTSFARSAFIAEADLPLLSSGGGEAWLKSDYIPRS